MALVVRGCEQLMASEKLSGSDQGFGADHLRKCMIKATLKIKCEHGKVNQYK